VKETRNIGSTTENKGSGKDAIFQIEESARACAAPGGNAAEHANEAPIGLSGRHWRQSLFLHTIKYIL
jgi:hypothetical protein